MMKPARGFQQAAGEELGYLTLSGSGHGPGPGPGRFFLCSAHRGRQHSLQAAGTGRSPGGRGTRRAAGPPHRSFRAIASCRSSAGRGLHEAAEEGAAEARCLGGELEVLVCWAVGCDRLRRAEGRAVACFSPFGSTEEQKTLGGGATRYTAWGREVPLISLLLPAPTCSGPTGGLEVIGEPSESAW